MSEKPLLTIDEVIAIQVELGRSIFDPERSIPPESDAAALCRALFGSSQAVRITTLQALIQTAEDAGRGASKLPEN